MLLKEKIKFLTAIFKALSFKIVSPKGYDKKQNCLSKAVL